MSQQNEKSNKRHRTNNTFDIERKQDAEWAGKIGAYLHSACCRTLMYEDVGTKEAFLVQLHRHNRDRGGGYLVEC